VARWVRPQLKRVEAVRAQGAGAQYRRAGRARVQAGAQVLERVEASDGRPERESVARGVRERSSGSARVWARAGR
jgi:hypothetical protein